MKKLLLCVLCASLLVWAVAQDAPADASTDAPADASTDAPADASTDAPADASTDAPAAGDDANDTAPAAADGGSDPMANLPESCKNLDPTSLDTSNPAAFATLLPCTGWDQSCQSAVAALGASCIPEIQAIAGWFNSSGVLDAAESAAGVDSSSSPEDIANKTAEIGAAVTPEMASSEIEKYTPDIKKALGTCCGGQITSTCCSAMTPFISQGCLCQQQPVELLKSVIGQDPANFLDLAKSVVDSLGCTALESAKVYPNCS